MTEIKLNLDNLSDEERERFFALIEKANKPKPGRWKPENGETYFAISCVAANGVTAARWTDDGIDKERFALGNVFKTAEDAKFALAKRKVEVLLQDIADELNDGWKPDWTNVMERKHFICYGHTSKGLYVMSTTMDKPGVYFKSSVIAREAVSRIGEDVLKKYIFEVE